VKKAGEEWVPIGIRESMSLLVLMHRKCPASQCNSTNYVELLYVAAAVASVGADRVDLTGVGKLPLLLQSRFQLPNPKLSSRG
jgi:hypothetical protein